MAYKDKSEMIRHNNDYNRGAYDRIGVMAKKDFGREIRAAAKQAGQSLNGFILSAVREKLSRDATGSPKAPPERNKRIQAPLSQVKSL